MFYTEKQIEAKFSVTKVNQLKPQNGGQSIALKSTAARMALKNTQLFQTFNLVRFCGDNRNKIQTTRIQIHPTQNDTLAKITSVNSHRNSVFFYYYSLFFLLFKFD